MRQLGRSCQYTRTDLPRRLYNWHAPRANRWECLCVIAGRLGVEWLNASGVTTQNLDGKDTRWIAPGTRWRVSHIDAHTRFQLEIYADDTSPASAPQVVRTTWLNTTDCVQLDDEAALAQLLAGLDPGSHCLAQTRFNPGPILHQVMAGSSGTLCWHPLNASHEHHTALIVRSTRPVGLLEYLGRDHAVIEAVLAGALYGNVEHELWLRNVLARHLVIEEDLLFPAYLDAGGNPGWVRGLHNEHGRLRRYLGQLADAALQRKFLLLLDGHDEKEEQIVYPDLLLRLGHNAEILAWKAMSLEIPPTPA